MKILVINGDCIQTNSSANLCHLAYINGLVDVGYDVTLICGDGRDYSLDPSMKISKKVKKYEFYGVTLYEKLALKKKKNSISSEGTTKYKQVEKKSGKQGIKTKIKKIIRSMYGVHGLYSKIIKSAKNIKFEEKFDVVLSLSTPASSHLLAHKLIKSKNVKTDKWIQIWEDPWYRDVYGFTGEKRIYKEEKRLLSFAQRVCYVSPITLSNQKILFPEYADKMYWEPLPYYYKSDINKNSKIEENIYGYFGEYSPAARDLTPFYNASRETNINVNICGNPSDLFKTTDNIHIYPRLSLEELKPIEDKTNVLIFLCNRKGGQIPGKIYQYSATYKTILFILDGTEEEKKVLKDYFEPFNRYIFCNNTEDDIIRAIHLIERGNLGDIKNVPLEEFNPSRTIKKILEG